VEGQLRRIVERTLRDLREDSETSGFGRGWLASWLARDDEQVHTKPIKADQTSPASVDGYDNCVVPAAAL
jgi:hypothetical protein